MADFPDDIFTEPADVDPDTLANLGPLARLAGEWRSADGVDLNPKADGPERREYIEHILMEPVDPQANGPQLFYGLRYHIHINTAEEDITFHDQVGYWLWEPATGLIIQSLSIPRGQVAIAGGRGPAGRRPVGGDRRARRSPIGICSTAFLEQAFRTDRYQLTVTFNPDGTWSYVSETTLEVRGQGPFIHRDVNTLKRMAAPKPNPLALILKEREAAGAK